MKTFKNNKGITITSLTIYVVVATIIVAILAFLNAQFFANINELTAESNVASEKMDFQASFLKDIKSSDDISVLNYSKNHILLSNNAKYEIRKVDDINIKNKETYAIFRNDIKIASNVIGTRINDIDTPYFDYDSNDKIIKVGLQFADRNDNINSQMYREVKSYSIGHGSNSTSTQLDNNPFSTVFTITYNSNNSYNQIKTQTVRSSGINLYDETQVKFTLPADKTLAGWNTSPNGVGGAAYNVGDEYKGEDLTLYAVWKDAGVYGIIYDDGSKDIAGDPQYKMHFNSSGITYGKYGTIIYETGNIKNDTVRTWGGYASRVSEITFENEIKPISIANWFEDFVNLTKINDINYLNTINTTNMNSSFADCSSLTSITLSGLNTANTTSMKNMFLNCSSLTSLNLSSLNTANCLNMSGMFAGCNGLTILNISGFNTEKVTDMSSMFKNCKKLTKLSVQSFDTSAVTNMESMFEGCLNLQELNLDRFDTSLVTSMKSMFEECSRLKTLDLDSFNTENVTSTFEMFRDCSNLESIHVTSTFIVDGIVQSDDMFSGCIKLVGGRGTVYNSLKVNKEYARIDGGTEEPGYFDGFYVSNTTTFTYHSNDGENKTKKVIVRKTETAYAAGNTWEREGYRFLGWGTTENGNVVYEEDDEITDLTKTHLYAIWEEI